MVGASDIIRNDQYLYYNWEAVGAYNAGLENRISAQRMVCARKVREINIRSLKRVKATCNRLLLLILFFEEYRLAFCHKRTVPGRIY